MIKGVPAVVIATQLNSPNFEEFANKAFITAIGIKIIQVIIIAFINIEDISRSFIYQCNTTNHTIVLRNNTIFSTPESDFMIPSFFSYKSHYQGMEKKGRQSR